MAADLVVIEPIAVQMTLDYAEEGYSEEDTVSLRQHAANIRGIVERATDEVAREFYEAKQIIHRYKKDGWAKYVEAETVFSVRHADRLVRQHEEKYLGHHVQNAIEQPVERVEEVKECVTLRTPREVVEQFFADFPNSEHLSNREIAKRCGVTEGTVRNYKKELFPEPAPEPEPTPDPEPIQTLVESTAPVENIPTPELPKLPKIELLEDIRQAREIKREQQRERNEQLKAKGVELPPDQYACLVIDPPWKMEKIDRDLYPNQVDFDYPTKIGRAHV